MSAVAPPPQSQSQLSSTIRPSRTLVLCFDGTNDQFDSNSTNLLRLFSALEKNVPREQLVYYQPGIGTYVRAEAPWSPFIRGIAKKIDSGLAWYISAHILGGYKFLMQYYQKGDKICLFGFSRGAFTARCLDAMLHKVGLLPRSNMEQAEFAYSLYESREPGNIAKARKFKEAFSTDVQVEYVGVWDTVSSVGLGAPRLPFNASETFVRTFRHAISIDERRAKFQANPWQYKKVCPKCHSLERTQETTAKNIKDLTEGSKTKWTQDQDCWCPDETDYHRGKLTDVKEVWFPGFHADVGGGNDPNDQFTTLANPSLRWMVNEILESPCRILFKREAFLGWLPSLNKKIHQPEYKALSTTIPALDKYVSDNDSEGESSLDSQKHEGSRFSSVTVAKESLPEADAQADWNDMLEKKRLWWILEVVPLYQYWFDRKKCTSNHGWTWNFGANRNIDHSIPYLHKSVLDRQRTRSDYKPEERVTFRENLTYVHEDAAKNADLKAELAAASSAARAITEQPASFGAVLRGIGRAFLRHR